MIGFGFLVPDVAFNEAYISFLLVHPDWQKAGIGTFMLYHLMQVCLLFVILFGFLHLAEDILPLS